jgi:NAD(P)-dependent dehydrogenase (short-subunit alcohol dehydrogenase family)
MTKTPVAIVTGGSRGIGAACCRLLAEKGYLVVVNYNGSEDAARAVVGAIEQRGGKAVAVQGDVAVESAMMDLFRAADDLGTLAVLVNNAGVVDTPTRVDQLTAARLKRMFDINVMGTIIPTREAILRMSTKHGGQGGAIVNIASVATVLGSPGQYVDYAAAKGAIDSFTIGTGREVAHEGIRVNAVRPGLIETDIHASGGIPDRVEQLKASIPMKRGGTPEEIAEAVVWLASPESSYVTGTILTVAGGRA